MLGLRWRQLAASFIDLASFKTLSHNFELWGNNIYQFVELILSKMTVFRDL